MIKKIISKRETKLVSIRRGIEESMRYFENYPNEMFTDITASWKDDKDLKPVTEKVILRREVVSSFLGVECLQYWKIKNGSLYLKKDEYLDLWEILKKNKI